MRKLLMSIGAAVGLAWASQVAAGKLAEISIQDRDEGARAHTYWHRGQAYISGTPGNRYAVVVQNKTAQRLLAVVSVDGVNVITGETASPNQSGYVLDPYGRVEITGWRKNMAEVAAFYFTDLPDSYAARTDRPDNIGVIGVALFREWNQPPVSIAPKETQKRNGAAADSAGAPAAAAEAESPRLGTGHGEREAAAARSTEFRRASVAPAETVSIYYDSYNNLVSAGIIPRPKPAQRKSPEPFPNKFAPDPC